MSNKIQIYTLSKSDDLKRTKVKSENFAPTWSSVSTYQPNVNVMYESELYLSLLETTNEPPSASPFSWKKISIIGGYEKNPLTSLVIDKCEWNKTTTYNQGSKVLKNGILFLCTTDGTSGEWDDSKWTTEYFSSDEGGILSGSLLLNGGATFGTSSLVLTSGTNEQKVELIGSDDGISFIMNGSKSSIVPDGTRILTEGNLAPNGLDTYTEKTYGVGEWVWYDGDVNTRSGVYVSNTDITTTESFNPSHWNCIDGLSSMFTTSNTALIRNVHVRDNDQEYFIGRIGSTNIFAPPSEVGIVITAKLSGSSDAVTGETALLYNGTTKSGTSLCSVSYTGTPVSFSVSAGMNYYVEITNNKHTSFSVPSASGKADFNQYVTLTFGCNIQTFQDVKAFLNGITSTGNAAISAASSVLVGREIMDYWVDENGITKIVDPMIITNVGYYTDSSDNSRLGAKMERARIFCSSNQFSTYDGIRTYLNTDATSGYKTGCSESLKSAISPVKYSIVQYNSEISAPEKVHATDSFFINSTQEVNAAPSFSVYEDEGVDQFYALATGFTSPSNNATNGRVKLLMLVYRTSIDWSLKYYALRSCYDSDGIYFRYIDDDGEVTGGISHILQFCPCCVILKDL